MPKTTGVVVTVNPFRRIGVVRVDGENHAVVGYADDHLLNEGDQLKGHFGTAGATTVQNVTTGEQFDAQNYIVDTSASDAHTFAA